MTDHLFIDQQYKKINFTESKLMLGEYESCTFNNCQFTNIELSNFSFTECEFTDCDLSGVKLNNTGLKDLNFLKCKILGVDFSPVNSFLLELNFDHCQLDLSSFYALKLKGIQFLNCQLKEVDFVDAELTGGKFHHCDLTLAIFENSILEKVDFSTAENFIIDPDLNRMNSAKFSSQHLHGLLEKHNLKIV